MPAGLRLGGSRQSLHVWQGDRRRPRDAIAAMHGMNTTKGANGGPPDPKALPANQQKGLEAVIAAHGQCH